MVTPGTPAVPNTADKAFIKGDDEPTSSPEPVDDDDEDYSPSDADDEDCPRFDHAATLRLLPLAERSASSTGSMNRSCHSMKLTRLK